MSIVFLGRTALFMKKIIVITGHYGSGKSNISANIALLLARENKKVTVVVDLDVINPYFRTADFKELFGDNNVELISLMYANTNIEMPTVNFDLEQLFSGDGHVILDVGGDDAGAIALGRFAEILNAHSNELEMLYVVNKYRLLTSTPVRAVRGYA